MENSYLKGKEKKCRVFIFKAGRRGWNKIVMLRDIEYNLKYLILIYLQREMKIQKKNGIIFCVFGLRSGGSIYNNDILIQ